MRPAISMSMSARVRMRSSGGRHTRPPPIPARPLELFVGFRVSGESVHPTAEVRAAERRVRITRQERIRWQLSASGWQSIFNPSACLEFSLAAGCPLPATCYSEQDTALVPANVPDGEQHVGRLRQDFLFEIRRVGDRAVERRDAPDGRVQVMEEL